MKIITEKNLKNHIGKRVAIEREGVRGNLFSELNDGSVVVKEGELLGVLEKDKDGFYVKMFKTRWDEDYRTKIDQTRFSEEVYRVQDRDVIRFYHGRERIVRLSQLETR